MPRACRKDDVLENARRLILLRGYENVSVRQIAAAAGVTTGAIYSNFRNKADILGILLLEAAERLEASMQSTAREGETEYNFDQYCEGYWHFHQHHPEYYRLILYISSLPQLSAELRKDHASKIIAMRQNWISGMVNAASKLEGVRPEQAPIVASAFVSLANGVFQIDDGKLQILMGEPHNFYGTMLRLLKEYLRHQGKEA